MHEGAPAAVIFVVAGEPPLTQLAESGETLGTGGGGDGLVTADVGDPLLFAEEVDGGGAEDVGVDYVANIGGGGGRGRGRTAAPGGVEMRWWILLRG